MSDHTIVLIGSSPASGKATTNINLVRRLVESGQAVQVCLLQDGVLAGLSGGWANAARAQAPGAQFCALEEDLALRGLGPQDLAQGIDGLSYDELVGAIMGEGVKVIGKL